ncbi:MAG: hypothetical protein A2Y15_07165 [Clostridiales bacterium GWF2_36_10]|nr:MAG: hypothetical protein A2Y15_07165 [Clostridiales bacterium GWF2_36_10]HAN21335.1 hypothetical protein [Clostridiales bacterium]
MTKFALQKRIIIISVIVTSLAISIYRIFVIQNNMDICPKIDDSNYYLEDNFETYLFTVISIFIMLIFLLAALYLGRKIKNKLVCGEPSIIFSTSLSSFIILGSLFFYIFYFAETIELTTLRVFILISAFISSIYFLVNASRKADTCCNLITWLSLAPVATFALRLLNDFIRQSTTPDASSTHFLLISIIAFLLFFLTESKFKAGNGNMTLYIIFGFATILFSLIYTIPTIILSAFWYLPTNYTTLYSVVDLSLALYIATRLIHLECIEYNSAKNDLEKQS